MATIRPFEPTDEEYRKIIELWNAVWPEALETVNDMKHNDATRDPERLFQRIVLDEEGRLPAYAVCMESPWAHVPGKFHLGIHVHPERRREGIATRLYEHILAQLTPRDPVKLVVGTREGREGALAMLVKYGFKQVMRGPISHLDVAGFDPAPFQAKRERVEASGIVIRTLADLKAEEPNWARRLYDLDWELVLDLPVIDPPVQRPFAVWEANELNSPNFIAEATFIALDGDAWVAYSQLWRVMADPGKLFQGMTGVARSHRRRGLATVLKLHNIAFAKGQGARLIETDNEENNPMFQINLQLGFQPRPAWLDFERPWEGARERG